MTPGSAPARHRAQVVLTGAEADALETAWSGGTWWRWPSTGARGADVDWSPGHPPPPAAGPSCRRTPSPASATGSPSPRPGLAPRTAGGPDASVDDSVEPLPDFYRPPVGTRGRARARTRPAWAASSFW
ncbi:hypothetical protein LV779_39240 [Streptomyces thinghirensis]|nr:hypothetical protein [Streptomyces thinghirensis]